ncbi:MAG: hypothetical protein ACR2OM_05320 [Aestuariivirgaceae bacterium]
MIGLKLVSPDALYKPAGRCRYRLTRFTFYKPVDQPFAPHNTPCYKTALFYPLLERLHPIAAAALSPYSNYDCIPQGGCHLLTDCPTGPEFAPYSDGKSTLLTWKCDQKMSQIK